jgi:hypothetical protein
VHKAIIIGFVGILAVMGFIFAGQAAPQPRFVKLEHYDVVIPRSCAANIANLMKGQSNLTVSPEVFRAIKYRAESCGGHLEEK